MQGVTCVTLVNRCTSGFGLFLSSSKNPKRQPFSSISKISGYGIPTCGFPSSHHLTSGTCMASQVAELFPTTSPEVVVREARIDDCWEVAETHCGSFFPTYTFPLDLALINRLIGMLFGFSAPNGCERTFLVAVIGSSGEDSIFLGSEDFKIGVWWQIFFQEKDLFDKEVNKQLC